MSTFFSSIRTDMAEELTNAPRKKLFEKLDRSDVLLSPEQAKAISKRAGKYITLTCDAVLDGNKREQKRLSSALADALDELLPNKRDVLIVGLGNADMTADTLGVKVAKLLTPSDKLRCLCPSVFGVTGIESFEIVKGVCERIKPSAVIAVDTLCAASKERLGRAFQLTDSGITPGSGVGNARKTLCRDTLSLPVISIGLPLVIYASAYSGKAEGELIVTPKDVDVIVSDAALVVAAAIEKIFS